VRKPTAEEVLAEYGGNAWGYANRAWLSDRRFSDDLQQEAMLALLEAHASFDWERATHPGEFGAYLKKAVSDSLMDFKASMSYATTSSGRSIYRGKRLHETSSLEEADTAIEWSDDSGEWFDAIMSTLDVLTPRQREVIGLYYLDGILSDTNVADVLQISQQAVSKLRTDAEERIREVISS